MQVTTSWRMRRPGTWNSTSLVTTVGTRIRTAKLDSSWPDVILGRNPNVPHFVGCRLEDPPLPADRSIAHVIRVVTEWVSGKLFVIVTVRLFANSGVEKHGPPVYEVVVGELPMSSESSGEHIQRDRVTSRRSAR